MAGRIPSAWMDELYARTDIVSVVSAYLPLKKDGRRYWHILDPKTGYPVETDVMGATIVSEASIDGDGFTKPLFMMNHEDALAFIEERQPLQGLLVLDDGTILQTENSQMELL